MKEYHVGFTGTQIGLVKRQKEILKEELYFRYASSTMKGFRPIFHHGGKMSGADAEAHDMARDIGYIITIHPPEKSRLRANCDGDKVLWRRSYLDRNHDIVNSCSVLIACPKGKEYLRSGTWATIRYARKVDKPVILIMP